MPKVYAQVDAQYNTLLSVFPNPQDGRHSTTIKYRFQENLPVIIQLYDVLGRPLQSWQPVFDDNTQECYYPLVLSHLAAGSYFLTATNGAELQSVQLVITQ